jgi:hypothetical protein
MKIDKYKTLVMQQNPEGDPGNGGDSCSESSRYLHLKMLLGDYLMDVDLTQFITSIGYIRHPETPWRENDMSVDQLLPLYLALKRYDPARTSELEARVRTNGYRVGNGNLVSPGFFAALKDSKLLINIATIGQALLFKLPYRYNDETKRLEKMVSSSADYLNYIHLGVYASKCCRKLVNKEKLKERIRHYYKPEPNCQFLIDLYDQVLERYF